MGYSSFLSLLQHYPELQPLISVHFHFRRLKHFESNGFFQHVQWEVI